MSIDPAPTTTDGALRAAVERAGRVFGWQHLPRVQCGQPRERAAMSEGRIILHDANTPHVEGGRYFIAYGELVDGYRHAYADPDGRRGRRSGNVRYSRDRAHPADPRCPECNPIDRESEHDDG